MITFKVPPSLGAGLEGEAAGELAAGLLAAGDEAAGELAAGDDTAGALETGGGAAEVDGAGLAVVAGALVAGAEVVGELHPIKTIDKANRITRAK